MKHEPNFKSQLTKPGILKPGTNAFGVHRGIVSAASGGDTGAAMFARILPKAVEVAAALGVSVEDYVTRTGADYLGLSPRRCMALLVAGGLKPEQAVTLLAKVVSPAYAQRGALEAGWLDAKAVAVPKKQNGGDHGKPRNRDQKGRLSPQCDRSNTEECAPDESTDPGRKYSQRGNAREYVLSKLARDADGDPVKAQILDDLLTREITAAEANRRAGYVPEDSLHKRNRNSAKSALLRLSVPEVVEILRAYCEHHGITSGPLFEISEGT
jgi:hypothetical protein